ncbi:MAG: carbohydate-binding domain-containing protein [Cyclobacteriaceae bacterium]|nr:carbohydate-binding domain-containing protein [Cyclobacteriaceae bacterium]
MLSRKTIQGIVKKKILLGMNKVVFSIISVMLIGACSRDEEKFASAGKIAVHWELLTNFTDETGVFEAKFELTNNGNFALTPDNWALFFNMAPRQILENKIPQPAALEHINGDWYKLVPNANFSLEPGKSIAISYRGVEAVIKETDRPLGLYLVFYDEGKAEENIVEVTNYTWAPFTRPEQINRSAADEEPIPTAAWTYAHNLAMRELPDSQLNRIIPSPVKMKITPGMLEISNQLEIYYQDDLENEARYLATSLKELTGTAFNVVTAAPKRKSITLKLGNINVGGTSKEAYSLSITDQGIVISGSDPAGVFYGVQSLRSLIPIEVYTKHKASFTLPFVSVDDAPRFSFRGLHLDVSRNFQSKETILRVLDLLSFYKINRFLLYTTEDEGWRLEIKDLPELTEVGAQRMHTYGKEAPVLHPAYGSGPFAKAEGKYGHGYYSREDFIEILKYAQARHIKVIPELNFPAHARAAIKAMESRYERLMREGKETEANEYRLIDPDDKSEYLSAQGYKDNVVCVVRESAFHFYEKVVDEINAMYNEAGLVLDEFHTGGDEVPEGAWTKSPLAAALMKDHPEIGDPQNLQTYFFRELLKRLKSRNFQIDGWEEVVQVKMTDGKRTPNAEFATQKVVPFIWNNLADHPDLGYRLANAGYTVVLCNVSNFYFDLAYNKDPLEPGLYWAGFVDERNAWTFAPYDMFKTTNKNAMGQKLDLESGGADEGAAMIVEHLKPEARGNILGVEAQVWSETIKGREMLEYYMLPKLIGFAESAWAAPRVWETVEDRSLREQEMQQQWNIYANALAKKELPRLSYLNKGYNYRVPTPGVLVVDGILSANVGYPGLMIRYTTDGSEPTLNSPLYERPAKVSGTVRLRSFDLAGKSSRTIEAGADQRY